MKLTNYHRQAFVKAVVNDIPQVDYQAQFEALIKADMLKVAHPKIAALLQDKELGYVLFSGNDHYKGTKGWSGPFQRVSVFCDYKPSDSCVREVARLEKLAIAQEATIADITAKTEGAIGSCTTLKTALERLPEFAKYLPKEEAKGTMLPAIANLAADLVKMGWPKGGVPA